MPEPPQQGCSVGIRGVFLRTDVPSCSSSVFCWSDSVIFAGPYRARRGFLSHYGVLCCSFRLLCWFWWRSTLFGEAAPVKGGVHTSSFPLDSGASCHCLHPQGCPAFCRFACAFYQYELYGLIIREFPFMRCVQVLASPHTLVRFYRLDASIQSRTFSPRGRVLSRPSPLLWDTIGGQLSSLCACQELWESMFFFPILRHKTNAMKQSYLISMSVS